MKVVYFIVTIARQIEGEMISIKFEKCFQDKTNAENFLKTLTKNSMEKITTPSGIIDFFCERGLHEIEVE